MMDRLYQFWTYNAGRSRPVGVIYCEQHGAEAKRLQPEGRLMRLTPSASKGRRCWRCGAEAKARPSCEAHGQPAVARISWTVYGGALMYRNGCDACCRKVNGQRGVDVAPLDGETPVPCPHVADGAKIALKAATTTGRLGLFCMECSSNGRVAA